MSNKTDKKIMLIEFNADSVYVQYEDMDSDTLSYSKAKEIFKDLGYKIRYSSCGTERAMDFCNGISRRKYFITEDTIEPKTRASMPVNGNRRW